jgi:hypothetical protein
MEQSHPVVLTHALDYRGKGVVTDEGAGGTRLDNEEYTDLLLSTLGEQDVEYMVKEYKRGVKTRFYSAPLFDFLEELQVSCVSESVSQ